MEKGVPKYSEAALQTCWEVMPVWSVTVVLVPLVI